MLFGELAELRLAQFKKTNKSVLHDADCARMLRYKAVSLWACEQQLLWERLHVMPKRRGGLMDFCILAVARAAAYGMLFLLILRMRLTRARILVYGIDLADPPHAADSRIAGIYNFLKESKIPYGEIMHTIFGRRFFINMARRRRPVLYLDLAWGARLFSAQSGTCNNPAVFERLSAAAYLPQSIAFIRRILRLTGARAIFAIDDTRYYYPLMIAAKECGIPFYVFQHGRFSAYMPGWAQYDINPSLCPFPDAVFVWSKYWREELLKISPAARLYADRVQIAGNPNGAPLIAPLAPPYDDGILTFLIPHEDEAPEVEIVAFIRAILSGATSRVLYKLRRGRRVPLFIKEFSTHESFSTCFDVGADDWPRIDAVLGSYSTFIYEAIALGRPVGVFDMASAEARDLINNGHAMLVRSTSILFDVRHIAATPWEEVCRRRAIFKPAESLYETLSGIMPV